MPSVTVSFWVVPVVVTFGVVTCGLVTRGFVVCVPWAVEVVFCAAASMGNCDRNAAMIRYLETVLFMWSSLVFAASENEQLRTLNRDHPRTPWALISAQCSPSTTLRFDPLVWRVRQSFHSSGRGGVPAIAQAGLLAWSIAPDQVMDLAYREAQYEEPQGRARGRPCGLTQLKYKQHRP